MAEAFHNRARSRARRLALQALYQCVVASDGAEVVVRQFLDDRNTGRADTGYFSDIVRGVIRDRTALEALIDPLLDRPLVQLDPVELSILLLATYELRDRLEVPWRVVLDEAVELAQMFGAEQSYRFINAVLDKLARQVRSAEAGR